MPSAVSTELKIPPHPPLCGSETGSFAETTLKTRLPSILDNILRDVGTLSQKDPDNADQVQSALAQISALRQDMLDDQRLPPLTSPVAGGALEECVAHTNTGLRFWQQHSPRATWLGLPWLFVECYLYVKLATIMQSHPSLAGYDPFTIPKRASWIQSLPSVTALAGDVLRLLERSADRDDATVHDDLAIIMQYALWGNKTDLSLIVDHMHLEQRSLAQLATAAPRPGAQKQQQQQQSESAADGGASSATADTEPSPLLVDDFSELWSYLTSTTTSSTSDAPSATVPTTNTSDDATSATPHGAPLTDTAGEASAVRSNSPLQKTPSGTSPPSPRLAFPRVDIVLDNSGVELYADLCLADALVTLGVTRRVVLHGKPLPWFVSDTLAGDLEGLLQDCSAAQPPAPLKDPSSWQAVQKLAARWRQHLADGTWTFTAESFWCTPAPLCWMSAVAPELYQELHAQSSLVIFKGDLNYRKATFDCRWPWTTSFFESLMRFQPCPLFILRTLKADVVTGLAAGQGEAVSALDSQWQVNGKYAVMQFAR